MKSNRQVNLDDTANVAVKDIDIPAYGRPVHLKGFSFIQMFRTIAPNGDVQHLATDDLEMEAGERNEWSRQVFAIENYHQLKQCCGVERAQARSANAQKCHILLSLRAFVRLGAHHLQTGISGYAAKAGLIREAVWLHLQNPTILLEPTA